VGVRGCERKVRGAKGGGVGVGSRVTGESDFGLGTGIVESLIYGVGCVGQGGGLELPKRGAPRRQ